MKNKHGFWRITFDTNPYLCNRSCIMCEQHSKYNLNRKSCSPYQQMDIGLIEAVLEDSKGTPLKEIIPSTMGEPLLYKDFEAILHLCKKFDLKLNLTTNGSFPKKGVKEWAELIVPVTSDVKFSWNGATKKTQEAIMVGSNYEQSLYNIKEFIKIRDEYAKKSHWRCQVTLQLTFIETNLNEIPDIIQLGIDLGVDRIKGHHLWAHYDEIKELSLRRNNDSIARWNAIVAKAQKIAQSKCLQNGKHIILENFYALGGPSARLVDGGVCPFLGKEAWVDHEGKFSPCCAPKDTRDKLGDFGNLKSRTLGDIYHSHAYKKLCAEYQNNPICKACNMLRSPHTVKEKVCV